MTTTTNFKIPDGTDLGNIFYPLSLVDNSINFIYSSDTGFLSGTTDLKNLFAKKGTDTNPLTVITGYTIANETDLNSIFKNINYPVINIIDGGGILKKVNYIELSDSLDLCFCFTTDSTTGDYYIQYSKDFKTTQTFGTTLCTTNTVVSVSSFSISGTMYIFYILDISNTSVINYYEFSKSVGPISASLNLSSSYLNLLYCSTSSNGRVLAVEYYNGSSYGIHFIINSGRNITNSTGRDNTKFLTMGSSTIKNITCSSVYFGQGLILTTNNTLYTFNYDGTSFSKSEVTLTAPRLLSNEININDEAYVNILQVLSNTYKISRYVITYSTNTFTLIDGTIDLGFGTNLNIYNPSLLRMYDSNNYIISYYSSTDASGNIGTGGFKLISNNYITTYDGQDDFTWCARSSNTSSNEITMAACKNSGKIFYGIAINASF